MFADGDSTTREWNRLSSGICVLPVGAFEQHSWHLPVRTDILQAEFFARHLAEQLDAALLPAQPFGTSFEHSGFRGTFGLRPETLMAVLRDLIDQAEEQHFHTLIIVNGHGGNFSLGPVVRDINHQDREIKILLANWYDHTGRAHLTHELHAGEFETSIMLHLFPQLVRRERCDVSDPNWTEQVFQRADLNQYGMGFVAPAGSMGFPSKASAELGRQFVETACEGLVAWARQRLEWRRRAPAYRGRAMADLRPLTEADIDAGLRLSRQAGWNQTAADWQRFVLFRPHGCFAAVSNGRVVGTAVTIDYQLCVGWVAMVLVDAAYRRRGIGRDLLLAAIDSLADCQTIKLDATADGQKLYETLDFVCEYGLARFVRAPMPVSSAPASVRVAEEADLAAIVAYDFHAFGVDRGQVLAAWMADAPRYALVAEQDGQLRGFCLGRSGHDAEHLGPILAGDADTAANLLRAALSQTGARRVYLDALLRDTSWIEQLTQMGFAEQRRFMRMYRGPNSCPGKPELQWAVSGPELG